MSKKSTQPISDDLGVPLPSVGKRPATKARRARIVEAAMHHFAKYGYEDARMEDLANELGIAKGSIFQHFGSKKRLLLEALKRANLTYQPYLEVPPEVEKEGFFATVRYWLEWANCVPSEDRVGFRLWLIGNYATGLDMKREISRMYRYEDPSGTLAFVHMGMGRGEVREDVDPRLLANTLDLMVNGYLEARFTEECDPGFFRNSGDPEESIPNRVDECLELIRSALGKR